MTHPRTALRALVVARLAQNLTPPPAPGQQPGPPTYRTDAGPRVHKGRLMPLDDAQPEDLDDEDAPPPVPAELPAIVVHTRDPEEVTDRSTSGWNGYERRRAILSLIAVRQSFDDLDAELDDMAADIEAALQTWIIPGFEGSELNLLSTQAQQPEFDGSLATGSITLRYEFIYSTPYRDCTNPYVQGADFPLEQSGAYPGGRVTAGCPAGNTGDACPIGDANLISQGEPIN